MLESFALETAQRHIVSREFTVVWCGFTALYFLVCLLRLRRRAVPIRMALRRVTDPLAGLDTVKFAEGFEAYGNTVRDQGSLQHAWREFEDSLVKPGEGDLPRIRNTHEPSLYFNEATVVQPAVHTRFFETVPSQLVGFGILGTFFGLAAGVGLASQDLTADDPAKVQEALSNLLMGASLAFSTSIVGLSLSLTFLWSERRLIGSVQRRLNKWVAQLEACVELVTPEQIALQQLEHAKRQTKQLEQFNTDLVFALEKVLDERVAERLVPELGKVVQAIDNLRVDRADSSQAAIERLVGTFSQTLTQTAGREMDQMGATLRNLGDKLQTFVGGLEESQRHTRSLLDEAAQNLRTSLVTGAGAAVAGLQEATGAMVRDLQAASRGIAAEIVGAGTQMRNSGQAATEGIAEAVASFTNAVGRFERVSAAQADLTPRFVELSVGLRDAGDKVLAAHEGFTRSLEPTRVLVRGLEAAGEKLSDSVDASGRIVQQLMEASQAIRGDQEKIAAAWEDYASRFQGIDQAVQRAFDRLREGVENYTEMIQAFHAEMDQHVGKAIQSLAAATADLHETVEDLGERMTGTR